MERGGEDEGDGVPPVCWEFVTLVEFPATVTSVSAVKRTTTSQQLNSNDDDNLTRNKITSVHEDGKCLK